MRWHVDTVVELVLTTHTHIMNPGYDTIWRKGYIAYLFIYLFLSYFDNKLYGLHTIVKIQYFDYWNKIPHGVFIV